MSNLTINVNIPAELFVGQGQQMQNGRTTTGAEPIIRRTYTRRAKVTAPRVGRPSKRNSLPSQE